MKPADDQSPVRGFDNARAVIVPTLQRKNEISGVTRLCGQGEGGEAEEERERGPALRGPIHPGAGQEWKCHGHGLFRAGPQ